MPICPAITSPNRFRHQYFSYARRGPVFKDDIALILITTHGESVSGLFGDKAFRSEFLWEPEHLWLGGGLNGLYFKGLKLCIKDSKIKRVKIVFAQCYGAIFADKFRSVVIQTPLGGVDVEVVGLSYGPTFRLVNRKKEWTIADLVLHQELLCWFKHDPTKVWSPFPLKDEHPEFDLLEISDRLVLL